MSEHQEFMPYWLMTIDKYNKSNNKQQHKNNKHKNNVITLTKDKQSNKKIILEKD